MKAPRPPSRDTVTWVARLTTDKPTAFRIHDAVCERPNDGSIAATVAEGTDGQWSIALYFSAHPEEEAVRALIALLAGPSASEKLEFERLAPTDWVRTSLEGLDPVEAGRFVVHGTHHRGRFAPNRHTIQIDPGLAFGTGHHASTLGCLLALDRIAKRKRHKRHIGKAPALPSPACGGGRGRGFGGVHGKKAAVLDVGTGSGVLAIAAAKALRHPVIAGDIDERAAVIARDNARLNGESSELNIVHAAGLSDRRFFQRAPYMLILANIVLEPLKTLATPVKRIIAPGGCIVLSGLLIAQGRPALAGYRARGLVLSRRIILGGWITLVLERPSRGRRRG